MHNIPESRGTALVNHNHTSKRGSRSTKYSKESKFIFRDFTTTLLLHLRDSL